MMERKQELARHSKLRALKSESEDSRAQPIDVIDS
jgi:hypothetical protein